MTVKTTYKIDSLDDLAEDFERRAFECSERIKDGGRYHTRVQKARDGGMQAAFEVCARILRNTTLDLERVDSDESPFTKPIGGGGGK